MKRSPIYPRYESGDHGFDPQVDFLQFLEEARKNTSQENYNTTPQHPEQARNSQPDEVKKNRKSWKRSLFSWWKAERKSMEASASNSSYIPKPKRGHISSSGPINGSGGGATNCKPRHPTSGPLTSLFHSTKGVEKNETVIPYTCLDKLDNNPHGLQSYGPLYLVT